MQNSNNDQNTKETRTKPQKSIAAATQGGNALSRYANVIFGKPGILSLIYFEFCMTMAPIPGAIGILLRSIFWPKLFGSCGKKVAFGANITLRHPHRIHLKNRIVLSEGCVLDARGITNKTIEIANDSILSNHVVIKSKNGIIEIGPNCSFGAYTVINSTNDCPIQLTSNIMTGPHCYIAAGASYKLDDLDTPIWKQGIKPDTGVFVGDDVWLGANVSIIGGVEVGKGSVLAAGAVVTKEVEAYSIMGGVPAKLLKKRNANAS